MSASQALVKARIYEREQQFRIPPGQKPSYHLCSPIGWINDPNGFSLFQGAYHLFYQYHPYDTHWGPMHWGHSRTKDFITWETLPAALAPDQEYDGQGCFSGSAMEYQGRHLLMYTGVLEQTQEDGTRLYRQTQCLALGNGLDYEKLDCNPVINCQALPEGYSLEDFRDPKIWQENGQFYMLAGIKKEGCGGSVALFTAKSLTDWKFSRIFEGDSTRYGHMWECPDFFTLDGSAVVFTSPQDMLAQGLTFHNGNGTMCLIGEYDSDTLDFQRQHMDSIDYGLDFYAPQTVLTADGRRIMIGWMQSWENYLTPDHFAWSGIMSIPRELHIINGHLYQLPVEELAQYYQTTIAYSNLKLNGCTKLDGIDGREFDMTILLPTDNSLASDSIHYREFEIRIASNDSLYSSILYDRVKETLTFCRTYSGIRKDLMSCRTMAVPNQNGVLSLRILMDKYTVEIFANEGAQAMSNLVYTPLDVTGISFHTDGVAAASITMHNLGGL